MAWSAWYGVVCVVWRGLRSMAWGLRSGRGEEGIERMVARKRERGISYARALAWAIL